MSNKSQERVKAILYTRVSSKEQEKDGFSIPAQLQLLKGYAQLKGFQVSQEFIDVETAKAAGRTQFREMAKFFQANPEFKILLVEKTDRLYRNFRDYVDLEELGLEIHLVKEGEILGKDAKSHTKLIHGIKVVLAKNYIDNLSEEVKKGMRQKVEQGGFPGKVPVGYVNNKETHAVELDPEKAPIIRQLFQKYATGNYTLAELRSECLQMGFSTRRSQQRISRSKIESILKNPFYTGMFMWNGNLYQGTHTPIVSDGLFGKVQTAFQRHNIPKRRNGKSFAFSGLVSCGRCGCAITAEMKKGRYIYYHCTNFKGKCGEGYIREEKLQDLLGELVKAIQIDRTKVDWIKDALRESHAEERAFHEHAIGTLRAQFDRLQTRIDQIYVDKLDGTVSEEFWRNKTTEWKHEQDQIGERLEAHKTANRAYYEDGIKILELANRAYSLYIQQSPHEQRRLLNVLLSNCTLTNGTLCPTYKIPFDLLAKRVKNEDWLGDQESNLGSKIQNPFQRNKDSE
ncbi:MAG TPA: recombinase family protein [Nitrospiraceae bacterium]|nr:recombinase family protein [Nitrospiraceae bacterium]